MHLKYTKVCLLLLLSILINYFQRDSASVTNFYHLKATCVAETLTNEKEIRLASACLMPVCAAEFTCSVR